MIVKCAYSLYRRAPTFLNAYTIGAARSNLNPVHQKWSLLRRFSISCIHFCSESPDDFQYEIRSVIVDPDIEAGDEPDKIIAMKVLALEIDLLRQTGNNCIPEKLTSNQWHDLLGIKDRRDREDFYKTIHDEGIRNAETAIRASPLQLESEDASSTLLEVWESKIEKFHDYRLSLAQIFGPYLLVDCGHESCVKPHELSSCAAELSAMWNLNRRTSHPFNIIFCNVVERSKLPAKLSARIPNLLDPNSFVNFSEKSYLDLFPVSQLVYLTPFSKNELGKFDGNCVYVMNAFVDNTPDTSSVAIAKRQKLRTAKFPIDKFLQWRGNVKTLPLDQCVTILNDLKSGASWQYSFRHIPREKLLSIEDELANNQKGKKHMKRKGYSRPINRNKTRSSFARE